MAKRRRVCPFCFAEGRTEEFETGNKLRQHVRARHQKTPVQKNKDRLTLSKFRREAIVALRRGTM